MGFSDSTFPAQSPEAPRHPEITWRASSLRASYAPLLCVASELRDPLRSACAPGSRAHGVSEYDSAGRYASRSNTRPNLKTLQVSYRPAPGQRHDSSSELRCSSLGFQPFEISRSRRISYTTAISPLRAWYHARRLKPTFGDDLYSYYWTYHDKAKNTFNPGI